MAELSRALHAILDGSTADRQESRTLDFKREGRSKDDVLEHLAEAAACFANASGGTVVVGVKDRVPGGDAFEGTSLDVDTVLRRVYELTVPSLTLHVDERYFAGVRLLVLEVPRSPDVHQVDNRATRRVATSCEPMSAAQIAALLS